MNALHTRYQHIDSIRGIAALLVVWMHVSEVFRLFLMEELSDYWMYTVAETLDFGRIGVVAFFAVSGFVIPSSFSGQGRAGLKVFVIKRFFRIYPVFWLSIPLAIYSGWYLWDRDISASQILANVTMLPLFLGEVPFEGLYWTLQIELIFYLLCALLFISGLLTTCSIAMLAPALYLSFFTTGDQNYLFLSIMFWGALFRAWHETQNWHPFYYISLISIPTAIIVVYPIYKLYALQPFGPIEPIWIKFLASHALGLALFIGLSTVLKIKQRPFAFLGEISYSIYLFHPVIFYPVYWWAGRTEHTWVREMPLVFWIIGIILTTIAFSYLVYRFVEKPSIRLGKKLSQAKAENTTTEVV